MIRAIQLMFNSTSSAVLLNNNIGEYFKTAVGVRQGCLLSPVMFNLYLENMWETLNSFKSSISIYGRTVSSSTLRRRHWPDGGGGERGGSNGEQLDLTNRLVNKARAYGMEVSSKSAKLLSTAQTTSLNRSMWTVNSSQRWTLSNNSVPHSPRTVVLLLLSAYSDFGVATAIYQFTGSA